VQFGPIHELQCLNSLTVALLPGIKVDVVVSENCGMVRDGGLLGEAFAQTLGHQWVSRRRGPGSGRDFSTPGGSTVTAGTCQMCGLDKRLLRRFEERLDVDMIVAEEHPQSKVGIEPAFLMRTPYAQGYHYSERSINHRTAQVQNSAMASCNTRGRQCTVFRILLCMQFGRLVAGCS
jgi:hypothetical protein